MFAFRLQKSIRGVTMSSFHITGYIRYHTRVSPQSPPYIQFNDTNPEILCRMNHMCKRWKVGQWNTTGPGQKLS